MDGHDRKRLEQVAKLVANGAILIHVILGRLDGIRLSRHDGDDRLPERLAEDFTMVRDDILPTVDAPPELLAITGSILLDWLALSDLLRLAGQEGATPRQLGTLEALADRLVGEFQIASDTGLLPGGPGEN